MIVVRGGTYKEALGWNARPATQSQPIVLQAYPGEQPVVSGTIALRGADFWRVNGFRFVYDSTIQSGQAIATFAGGTGWTFENNEVTGTTGVANLIIEATKPSSTTNAALIKAAPNDYTVSGNCITQNRGYGEHGTMHNIYLMSSIYSTGGLIERNFLAGAPRGANIKAAASTPATANASPRNVLIRNNTMLYAASGVTIGLKSEGISVEKNLIALPSGSQQYDGGVKTYQLARANKNAVKDSLISGYTNALKPDFGATTTIFTARNSNESVAFTGSVANCNVVPTSAVLKAKYGALATG
ncbi:hypothetical protein [Glaciibacter psychrotolerans]|uniref:Right-handed parallel beta-helix repeat-containing protein n=1 Tax=Glaciibacter psychrotolerans TaxID=670054 RepID=A0A7Z0EFD7_9MICO|nr:hypothetical protein [Leifsonia psychrotolerans]NYJ20604.1 hypothetical protein [Leifsonia psychrotolerans]